MKTSIKEQIKKIDEQIQILNIKKKELINLDNQFNQFNQFNKINKTNKKYEKPLNYTDCLLSYII